MANARWSKPRRLSLQRKVLALSPHSVHGTFHEVYGDGLEQLGREMSLQDIDFETLSSPACDRASQFVTAKLGGHHHAHALESMASALDFATVVDDATRRLKESVERAKVLVASISSTVLAVEPMPVEALLSSPLSLNSESWHVTDREATELLEAIEKSSDFSSFAIDDLSTSIGPPTTPEAAVPGTPVIHCKRCRNRGCDRCLGPKRVTMHTVRKRAHTVEQVRLSPPPPLPASPSWIERASVAGCLDAEIYARRRSLVGHEVAVLGSWWIGSSGKDKRQIFKCRILGVQDGYNFCGLGSRKRNKYRVAFTFVVVKDLTQAPYLAAVSDLALFVSSYGIDPPDDILI